MLGYQPIHILHADSFSKSLKGLRMYCIDTGAIAFMFSGGSSCASTIHPIDFKICILNLRWDWTLISMCWFSPLECTYGPVIRVLVTYKKFLKKIWGWRLGSNPALRRKPQEGNLPRFWHQMGFPITFTKVPIFIDVIILIGHRGYDALEVPCTVNWLCSDFWLETESHVGYTGIPR